MPVAASHPRLLSNCSIRAGGRWTAKARPCKKFSTATRLQQNDNKGSQDESNIADSSAAKEEEAEGAMSRRLSEMQDRDLEEGGRGARTAILESGFNDELKQKLLNKIADANFKNENAAAFSLTNMPQSAGQGTRETATATPWDGTESIHDASLRMLDDASKPMRGPAKIPTPRGPPQRVDTGRTKRKPSSGARIANARDRSSTYALSKDLSMTEKEREQYQKELKERFAPAGRPIPASIQGLAALANERIEDAIARGQFKNLPRGKKIERDHNASSPFLDTTEYFMNKIIQKQEIVPPWIEKQQELVSAATRFRSRLRAEWRRHAARVIGSRGGTIESQVRRAEAYAAAEVTVNPLKNKEEKLNLVDDAGHLSQITLSGQLHASERPSVSEPTTTIQVTEETLGVDMGRPESDQSPSPTRVDRVVGTEGDDDIVTQNLSAAVPIVPFRDAAWEKIERAYHDVAIDNLNTLTRSYNLMAPNLAKKPYFSLERELRACYAEVAPQLANEIRERASTPRLKIEVVGHKPGGVLDRFGTAKARVYDEKKPQYGFKQFWRDLFAANT